MKEKQEGKNKAMQELSATFSRYMENLYIPSFNAVTKTDIIEVIIITFMIYAVLVWVKETRAWALLRGVLVICAFLLVAFFTKMTTILWMAERLISLAVIAMVVILQPELRKALENLGQKNIIASLFSLDMLKPPVNARFSDRTINEIVKACVEMGKVKTGALIVVEHKQPLTDYEKTGIDVDGLVSNQLLINIFEHNTPLHDGAIIIRGDRIVSATCYLPLSDNMGLSKELGTRHRAAVGMSEVSDALVIAVSEETGAVSVAQGGILDRAVTRDELREKLTLIQAKKMETSRFMAFWKGRHKNEKKADE